MKLMVLPAATVAAVVDLLDMSLSNRVMPLPSAATYISRPQVISVGLPAATLYLAATAEYDLRPLSDDLPTVEADDLLADILAESQLVVPL